MLTLGALLVCGALLAFAALTLVFRRPEPPRWTRLSGVGEMVTLLLTACLTFGMGYLAAGAVTAYQQGVARSISACWPSCRARRSPVGDGSTCGAGSGPMPQPAGRTSPLKPAPHSSSAHRPPDRSSRSSRRISTLPDLFRSCQPDGAKSLVPLKEITMLTNGSLLLCSVLLAFAALSRVCDRPVPPRWTKRSGVAELLTRIFATLIVSGLGSLAAGIGAVGAYQGSINPVDLGIVALVLAGTAVLWWWLSARDRAAHPTAAAPVVTFLRPLVRQA